MLEDPNAPNPYAPPRTLESLAPELTPSAILLRGGGCLSWQDFQAGVRLSQGPLGRVRLFAVPLFVLGTLLIASGSGWEWSHPSTFVLGALLVIVLVRWWKTRRATRLIWAHPDGLSRWQAIAASDDGILIQTEPSTALLRWSRFSSYRLSTRVMLLIYQPALSSAIVPRSFFASDKEWHDFVDLVHRHVPQG